MQAERQQYLGAAPYQRTPERQGQANGYKPKTVKTRVGEITFDIPQVRQGGFYPEALEKGLRSERASHPDTGRDVRPGCFYSQGDCDPRATVWHIGVIYPVSKATALLDETLEAWRQPSFERMSLLFLGCPL